MEHLVSSHSTSGFFFFLPRLMATPPFGEIHSPTILEPSVFFSFTFHIQTHQEVLSILPSTCTHNPATSHDLLMTTLLWAPINPHLTYCNCLSMGVCLRPLLLCSHCQHSKQTATLEYKMMALPCFSGFLFHVNGKLYSKYDLAPIREHLILYPKCRQRSRHIVGI